MIRLVLLILICSGAVAAQSTFPVACVNTQPTDQNAIQTAINSAVAGVAGSTVLITGACAVGTNSSSDSPITVNTAKAVNICGASCGNSVTWNTADAWLRMNTSSPGTALTPSILAAGTVGESLTYQICTVSGSCNNASSAPTWTLQTNVIGMGGSITVPPVSTNYPTSSATQSMQLSAGTAFVYLNITGFNSTSAATANGFITFGATNVGCSGQNMDLVTFYDSNGHFAVLQFVPGNAAGGCVGYGVRIETDGNGTQRSENIYLTQGNTYAFSLLFDGVGGTARLAMMDPTNNYALMPTATTGAPYASVIQHTGGTISHMNMGNAETGTAGGNITFTDISIDQTNHIWPNYPQSQDTGQTIIFDNNDKGQNGTCVPLFNVSVSTNSLVRFSGFTTSGVAPDSGGCQSGVFAVNGSGNQFRVDHMTAQNMVEDWFRLGGYIFGVADHNQFGTGSNTGQGNPFEIGLDSYQGVGANGDNSWAQPDTMGSASAFYIETNNCGQNGLTLSDGFTGARVVNRFNNWCAQIDAHGLDSQGRGRSMRHSENYGNTFIAAGRQAMFYRGGTTRAFGNRAYDSNGSSFGAASVLSINDFRRSQGYPPWSGNGGNGYAAFTSESCNGNSPYDKNDGTTYASGTASASSASNSLVANGTPGWTANQWVGYSLINTNGPWGSWIVSNTTNTITTLAGAQGEAHNWASGNSFLILRATACADQVGFGQGALLQSSNPVLNSTGSPGPVNQVADPLYQWLNQYAASAGNGLNNSPTFITTGAASPDLLANDDYYDYTTSFTGATGVGSGTLTTRPATCTVGVGYWATNQGNWNASGNGFGNGELFICTATNTWTLSYVPFTYPHPLVSGAGGTPGQPSVIVVQ